jgi:acetyl esterase/lipase
LRTANSIQCLLTIPLICFSLGLASAQQTAIKLWPKGAPGSEGSVSAETVRLNPDGEHIISNIQEPSIIPYLPRADAATGAAVIVAPGGGHSELWMDHEGYAVAEWLSSHGVAAFILKYRLARQKDSTYTVEGTELGDMQRAIRTVRSRSKEWGIDPARIGVMGFSAGGELAALASTRYDDGSPSAEDPVERVSSKPAFQALLYPAIPHDPRLTAETPRAFLACGGNDRPDISQGLAELYLALSRLHVSTELHIYAGIGHGFGVRKTNPAPVSGWTSLLLDWMSAQGLLKH